MTRINTFVGKTADGILASSGQRRKEGFFPVVQRFLYSLQID
jgi:hypothetical protein